MCFSFVFGRLERVLGFFSFPSYTPSAFQFLVVSLSKGLFYEEAGIKVFTRQLATGIDLENQTVTGSKGQVSPS